MRRYILIVAILGLIGVLIYFSSIYLVKAEYSVRNLEQKTEELEERLPQEEPNNPLEPASVKEPPKGITFVASTEPPREETITETKTAEPRISMEFEGANLRDVLKIFCQQSGLNFIAGENVELKPVTLYLNNVSVDDALNSIIRANGLIYERAEGSNVFIVTKSPEPEVRLETKIFRLNYASAEDRQVTGVEGKQTVKGIKETIQKLLSKSGDLSIDTRTNSLIVSDIPSRLSIIENAIKDLDSQLPQILIEARIVQIDTTSLDQLGIKWTSLAGYTLRFQDPLRAYTSTRTSDHTKTDEYTNTRDTSITDNYVDGVTSGTTSETITIDDTLTTGSSITDTFAKTLSKSDIRSAILSADDFAITLSLLLTNTDADLIASPNIVTEHSKEAKITVGEQYPLPNYTYNQSTAVWEVTGFEYRDIGIILRVTPYADKDRGIVSLELHPEVSDIAGYAEFRGAQIPRIGTRDAITNVSIKDGDTLAIGGLIKEIDRDTITKVPLLGDIPVIRYFFRHKEKGKTKTNLIIFITPHILTDTNQLASLKPEVTVPVQISGTPASSTPAPALPVEEKKEAEGEKDKYKFSHR